MQDLPLKLARFGRAYARVFPHETALVTTHPEWQRFYTEVLARDAAVKSDTQLSRDFKRDPRKGLNLILQGHPAVLQTATPLSVPKADALLTKREREVRNLSEIPLVEHGARLLTMTRLRRAPLSLTWPAWKLCARR